MTYGESQRRFNATVNRPALKMAMTFKRITQRELAMQARVSKGTIGNLVTKRATCNPETAARIAAALGLRTDDLFTLTPLMPELSTVKQTRRAA